MQVSNAQVLSLLASGAVFGIEAEPGEWKRLTASETMRIIADDEESGKDTLIKLMNPRALEIKVRTARVDLVDGRPAFSQGDVNLRMSFEPVTGHLISALSLNPSDPVMAFLRKLYMADSKHCVGTFMEELTDILGAMKIE